ncbi:hypothetical protein [Paraflavitalea pollutisoli]|uniref:hypothetical protein n=1 Tax=Paraflavitalea pollutisoli TaxID=3034143 RepID=UPI0023ECFD9E|nr:hypothetical protein [Paraflavitalea sp. H1-2-19X]
MKSIHLWWLLLPLILTACQPAAQRKTITRAFYYWKSTMHFTASEMQALDTLHVQKMYIKCFDVAWDPVAQNAMPLAKVQLTGSATNWLSAHPIAIIPTVFITNECMQRIAPGQVAALANNLHALMQRLAQQLPATVQIPEIQLDCDWTATSQQNYFALLTALQQLPFFQQKQVSATIRLYQCKYKEKTGVPPVNRGLLMCYNMGNLKNPDTHNSILEANELAKYIGNLQHYPLPLDVAFPLFDWKVLYQDKTYKGLIQGLSDTALQQPGIAVQQGNRYTLLVDTTLQGYSLKKGDMIRQEDATFAEVIRSARLLRSKLVTPQITVALYHLDSLTLHKYSTNELETMFSSMY